MTLQLTVLSSTLLSLLCSEHWLFFCSLKHHAYCHFETFFTCCSFFLCKYLPLGLTIVVDSFHSSLRLNFASHQNFQTSRTKERLCRGPRNQEHTGVSVLRNTPWNTLLIEKQVCELFVLVDSNFPEPGDGPQDGPDTRLLGENVGNSVS